MKKIILEIIAVIGALAVAGVIILFLFTQNIGQVTFDTFSGTVNKTPVNITSPVYGQIMTLPTGEGDTVKPGQILATIHILNPNTIPVKSPLYSVNTQTMILQVLSPTSGVVGQVYFAPLSTVAGAGALMQIYTANSMEIQVLIPQKSNINDYAALYASHPPDQQKYLLHIVGQIPTNVLANIDPTTSVYQATCTHCQALLDNQGIAIYAQRKQENSPFLDKLNAFIQTIAKRIQA